VVLADQKIGDAKISRKLPGHEDYLFQEVVSQEAALSVIVAFSGWYETSIDNDDVWSALTGFAPYSEMFVQPYIKCARLKSRLKKLILIDSRSYMTKRFF
jgi:hypothetical protein